MSSEKVTKIAVAVSLGSLLVGLVLLFMKCSSPDAPVLDDPFDYQKDVFTE